MNTSRPADPAARIRLSLVVRGTVQGVGFRPHVSRVASRHAVGGGVRNTVEGVHIDVEGRADQVFGFRDELVHTPPYDSLIHDVREMMEEPRGEDSFVIAPSTEAGARSAWITPDLAICSECVRDLFDPADRRYRYPFTSCARCGPRYSILEQLPFDREHTVMRHFPLCPDCRREYDDPHDRRHHAQTIACPACGPRVELLDGHGEEIARDHAAIEATAGAIRRGQVVGLQGLGGFQLLVDATDEGAVRRLRERKRRPRKPLAVMFRSLDELAGVCELGEDERHLLSGPQSPILLLERMAGAPERVAPSVAPGNPLVGAMIPYTPLHHLLMRELDRPMVATSGNLSGEPICITPSVAMTRLDGIVDCLLVHDRPILRPVDDSVVRMIDGDPMIMRVARGYAPLTLEPSGFGTAPAVLATGAHLKNTVAIGNGRELVLSQHIGDLDAPESRALLARTVEDLVETYRFQPEVVIHDDHPDYASTLHARELALGGHSGATMAGRAGSESPRTLDSVQHHHAHVVSCMVEHELDGEVLGITWDGTGLGPDGTIWGGEFLKATRGHFERAAHFRTFPMPGGEVAIHDPCRTALGMLWECEGQRGFDRFPDPPWTDAERRVLSGILRQGVNAPRTSAVGRLFDGVAALGGLCRQVSFEGEAAMALEFAAPTLTDVEPGAYPHRLLVAKNAETAAVPIVIDWVPMVDALLDDVAAGVSPGTIGARFQRMLVEGALATVQRIGADRVVLTGGCFQNRALTEGLQAALEAAGHEVFTHRRIPPNDGGLAVGQAAVARERT